MIKLFEVEITIRAVVVADHEEDASVAAWDNRYDILGEVELMDFDVCGERMKGQRLPGRWNENCYPYGGDGDKTIKQIWEEE